MEAPQLDFDLQLASLPTKQVESSYCPRTGTRSDQYFIISNGNRKQVCTNFPFCSCESCRTALTDSGYVCLIEEKSLAANQRPLILPNGVLSGLSAAALRYFADTRLLKDALDMMTEETTWLETNTAQAKTHFSYNHVAGHCRASSAAAPFMVPPLSLGSAPFPADAGGEPSGVTALLSEPASWEASSCNPSDESWEASSCDQPAPCCPLFSNFCCSGRRLRRRRSCAPLPLGMLYAKCSCLCDRQTCASQAERIFSITKLSVHFNFG